MRALRRRLVDGAAASVAGAGLVLVLVGAPVASADEPGPVAPSPSAGTGSESDAPTPGSTPSPSAPESESPTPAGPAPSDPTPSGPTPSDGSSPSTPAPTTPPPGADPEPTSDPAPTPSAVPSAPVTHDSGPARRGEVCEIPGLTGKAEAVEDGHFDYGVQVKGGELRSRVKDDRTSPARWVPADTLVFSLQGAAEQTVPQGDGYAFLGEPGDTVWTIGQTQSPDVPWLGWNTQHPTAVEKIKGSTTWRLRSVSGPGTVFLYQNGSFGSVEEVLSTEPGWPRKTVIAPNVHAHGNWSFTEPGVYRIRTTHVSRLTTGKTVKSTDTLFFQAGPCSDEATGDGSGGSSGDGADEGGSQDDREPARDGRDDDQDTPSAPGASARPGETLVDLGGTAAQRASVNDPGAATATLPSCLGAGPATSGSSGTVGGPSSAPVPNAPTPVAAGERVGEGHFDFGPQIEAGTMSVRVKDDRTQPPAWVEPSELVFVLGAAAEQQVPTGGTYSFLGAPGDPIWLVPQTQVSGVPWLGWNTQDASVREQVQGPVRYSLSGVTGPGELAVYLTDSFGGVGEKVVGTVGGFPSSFSVPLNVHAHGNWVFTEPGSYSVRFTVSATLRSGAQVSDQAVLAFAVGGDAQRREVVSRSSARLPATGALSPPFQAPASRVAAQDSDEGAAESTTDDEDCLLPATGASASTSALFPLGLLLLGGGGGLLVWRRRLD